MRSSGSPTSYKELSRNIVAFCMLLRQHGVPVGTAEEVDSLRALELIDISNAEVFRLALRLLLAKNIREQQIFDNLFPDFWTNAREHCEAEAQERNLQDTLEERDLLSLEKKSGNNRHSLEWVNEKDSEAEERMPIYSPFDVFTRRDFNSFQDSEVEEFMHLVSLLARRLALQLSRRYRQTYQNALFDFRKTLRINLRRGGEILDLAFRRRRTPRLRLVMLCDVSKSMGLYSRFLIQFVYAFQNVYRRIETFVFSTSLHRVTEVFRAKQFSSVLEELPYHVPDWSGGTRIGFSLKAFLEDFGGLLLDRKTVVVIMSDGWDTGNIDLLAEGMRQIHERAGRVIWLNPLLGYPDYQPTCRGMQVALPYIDVFAPAHNLDSLQKLVQHLSLSQGRLMIN